MGEKLKKLSQWGCDVENALKRTMGDEEFYYECINCLLADAGFAGMDKALSEQNSKKAFEYAHMLKGVLGNLGLTPMYNKDIEIVEILRNGSCSEVIDCFRELMHMKDELKKIMGD